MLQTFKFHMLAPGSNIFSMKKGKKRKKVTFDCALQLVRED